LQKLEYGWQLSSPSSKKVHCGYQRDFRINNLVKYLKSSHFKDTMLSSQDNVAILLKFTIPLENEQSKLQVPISSH
jgi:hypothetical protein